MRYRIVILTTLTLVFSNSLNAQVNNTIYSMFGVGQILENSYGVNKSLGGTGIAFQSGRSINYLNPASYLGVFPSSLIMEIGVYGTYNKSETRHSSQNDANINVSYFAAGLYITDWWAFSVGIVPFSSMKYEVTTTAEIGGDPETFEKKYTGNGGLNKIYFGNSFNIYKGLSAGFNASYIFGPITQTETALSNNNFSGYELTSERTTSTFYLDYGLQYSLRDSNWSYNIGLIYGSKKKLNFSNSYGFNYNGTTTPLEQENQPEIKIPQKIGLGISIKNDNNFRAGFDYVRKNWTNTNFTNPYLKTKNSNRFSIGVEFSFLKRRDSSLFESLFYRFGLSYEDTYLEVDKTRISSKGICLGLGIPYDENMINLSMEYGEEGTLDKGLIKTSYWMCYLSISLYEFWSLLPTHD